MFRPYLLPLVLTLAACDAGSLSEEVVLAEPVVSDAAPAGSAKSPAKSSAIIAPVPLPLPVPSPIPPAPGREPKRGVITAGDIDDTLNLAAFQRYVSRSAKTLRLPRSNFSKAVRVQLTDARGAPAPGTFVTMRKPGANDPFWSGYSGVNGMLTVFPAIHGAGNLSQVQLRALPEGGQQLTHQVATSGSRVQIPVPGQQAWRPEFLDLVIVMDTTGSMGDELAWITKELDGIVSTARRAAPGVDIRYGLIVYRDKGDAYVVRNFGFTNSQSQMTRWLKSQHAGGGGDYPEAAAAALKAAAGLNWRRGKGERLMFHIADAPAHKSQSRAYLEAARAAAQKNIQIFGLGASGVGPEAEYLMRSAAVQTQGRYLFLTDDSGVGLSHAEPSISCYRVTRLTGLMKRVLQSELSGNRIEARPSEVIRTVGAYANGRCRT